MLQQPGRRLRHLQKIQEPAQHHLRRRRPRRRRQPGRHRPGPGRRRTPPPAATPPSSPPCTTTARRATTSACGCSSAGRGTATRRRRARCASCPGDHGPRRARPADAGRLHLQVPRAGRLRPAGAGRPRRPGTGRQLRSAVVTVQGRCRCCWSTASRPSRRSTRRPSGCALALNPYEAPTPGNARRPADGAEHRRSSPTRPGRPDAATTASSCATCRAVSLAEVRRLEGHVRRGGGVVILPGRAGQTRRSYNELLYRDGNGLLPAPAA